MFLVAGECNEPGGAGIFNVAKLCHNLQLVNSPKFANHFVPHHKWWATRPSASIKTSSGAEPEAIAGDIAVITVVISELKRKMVISACYRGGGGIVYAQQPAPGVVEVVHYLCRS